LRGRAAAALLAAVVPAAAAGYDPLAVDAPYHPQTLELTLHDAVRERDIPLRIYLPSARAPEPVVLFSHGLGGSNAGNAFLGEHWARRGYVAVFVQHPGSDTSVWQDRPARERANAMRSAANVDNLRLRVGDIRAVVDQLARWNADPSAPLARRMDLAHVGMSGHSFGAITTQALAGERFRGDGNTDARIKAAILFSPSSPRLGDARAAFGAVSIPWMLMTGTEDTGPIAGVTPESRQAVFPALPPGRKYLVVLDRAEHSAFTDRALPGEREPRNPNHHRVMLALSTAFWDACLRGDAEAQRWLDGDGPRGVLQHADRWSVK